MVITMGVPREKLYGEVWTEAMTTVAKRYKVSSSFLARICERLNVPRPPRGYWAKLAFGKAPKRPPLPEARPGDETQWVRGWQDRYIVPLKPPDASTQEPALPLSVHRSRHPLVVEARSHFEAAPTEGGFLMPAKRSLMDLVVSKDVLPRTLRGAARLFRALENRGHHVVLAPRDQRLNRADVELADPWSRGRRWSPERPTVVYVGTVAIGLSIFEPTEEAEFRMVDGRHVRVSGRRGSGRGFPGYGFLDTQTRYVPAGKLCLRAYSPYGVATWKREWRESKPGEFDSICEKAAQELERAAPEITKLFEEGDRRDREEKQQIREQLRAIKREEAERGRTQALEKGRDELLGIIEEWGLAKRIEAFFEDAEYRAKTMDRKERAVILERIQRARELVGPLDALQRFRSWSLPTVPKGDLGDDALEDNEF
jgi:hypothetical protein